MTITKVALAGATGNLGQVVLQQLLNHQFEVTVLSRTCSSIRSSPLVRYVAVDYSSLDSLTSALHNQDAVVSTIASSALQAQFLLIEAAKRTGVRRFIPSEYGSDTRNTNTRGLPVYETKVKVQDMLEEAARTSSLTYTVLMSGAFMDWGSEARTLIDLKNKNIKLFDGGERLYSTTTLEDIGRGIAGVLQQGEETKNRSIYIHSAALTLKHLAHLGKMITGPDGWTETVVSTDELAASAWEGLRTGQGDQKSIYKSFISVAMFAEGFGGFFEKTDNAMLGISIKSDEEILEMLRRSL